MHAHHINGNKQDNRVENIQILANEEHVSLHSRDAVKQGKIKWDHLLKEHPVPSGSDHFKYIHVTKKELEEMIRNANGVLRKVPMDDATL